MSEFEDVSAAAQALAAVPFLASLAPVDLAKLAGVLEDRWIDAGTVVFEAGGAGNALFILREGIAERRVAGSVIDLLQPLAVFGQLALLTDEPRSASIVAITQLRLWVLPRQRFDGLLRVEPELMLQLSAAIGIELAQARRALAELQLELDLWITERLAVLTPAERALVEAAALFVCPPRRVLAQLSGGTATVDSLSALEALTPLLHPGERSHAVPPAIRRALRRRLDTEHRTMEVAARVHGVAAALELHGELADAATAYLAAGAIGDAQRVLAKVPSHAWDAIQAAAGAQNDIQAPATTVQAARIAPAPRRQLDKARLASIGVALTPFLFWMMGPPEGLSLAGWHALLTIVSAAIFFASEALPEAVIALALLAVWAVTGIAEPSVVLSGFATQAWILVLAVLAVGVAVGNTGLLYRVALIALGRKPAGFAKRCLTLALVGAAVTPTLPNATSRMALAAPMVREVAEALGYVPGGKAATGLALAALIGFGQMAGLFLTGSSVGLLVYGLLPADTRAEFSFLGWFLAALPLHLVLFAASMAAVTRLYRPSDDTVSAGDRLALQRAVLGPMRYDEKLCIGVLVGLILGFLTEPLHGINGAWLGVSAMVVLATGRVLDTTMLRAGVNWPFLIFFGVIASLASVFDALNIDTWLAATLTNPIQAVAGSSLVFCLVLAIAGFALSFVVRWQAAAPLLTLVALPAAGAAQVHPFLVALLSLVATQVWFLPYQSTVYLALYHGSGELFTHQRARLLAWLWGPLVLASIVCAMPVWRAMGLLQ